MLILVEVLVRIASLGEVDDVAEVVYELFQELHRELVTALTGLCELLIVVPYLYLGSLKE